MRWSFIVGLLMVACTEPSVATPPELNRAEFDTVVYPLLMRDCGFPACHGNSDRFFRVFGPGRNRLDEQTALTAEATEAEREAAYERARSMLTASPTPEQSLLVRKPLEVDQGGAPHMGIDQHGRDVYSSPNDPSFQAILQWARGGMVPGADVAELAVEGEP